MGNSQQRMNSKKRCAHSKRGAHTHSKRGAKRGAKRGGADISAMAENFKSQMNEADATLKEKTDEIKESATAQFANKFEESKAKLTSLFQSGGKRKTKKHKHKSSGCKNTKHNHTKRR